MSADPKSNGERPPWYGREVSMTNGAASKKTSSITVGAVLERIRSDYWKIPVERVQFKFAKAFDKATKEGAPDPVGKAKSAVDAAKRDLPGVCWSGSFSETAIANLLEHSGYICADCDNLGDRIDSIRQQLRNDPHVQAFFTSPTGTGLKVLIRIEASKESHERSYLTVEKHFRDVYKVEIDKKCKDVSRLCFVGFDPGAFIRGEEAAILEPLPEEPVQPEEFVKRFPDHERIVAIYGEACIRIGNALTLNENYFVGRFVAEHRLLYDQKEAAFYFYEASDGAWHKSHYDVCRKKVREDFGAMAVSKFVRSKGTAGTFDAITNRVRVVCGTKDRFKRLPRGMIHCANGMFQLHSDGTVKNFGFSPEFYSRNPIPIAYDPKATCPRFMNEVLKYAMDPDDLSLFVRWFGPCLLTGNKAQKFLILVGKPETSKTLLLNVVEGIIGRHNTTALRTSLLHERFEIGRFADKTMLTAKDVDGDFLQYKSAHIVKLQTELEELEVTGDFAVAMTCNETLRCKVKGESDRGAWQRRAMIINFSKKALRRIAGFDEQLIKEEGPGILALAVKGAMLHLAELEDGGDFKMTAGQMLLVDKLLNESESAKFFVQKRIHREAGRDLTSEEINEAYVDFCEEMGWKPDPMDVFKRHLPDLMLEIYGSQKGTHGKRPADDSDDWTRRNVYTNVALNGPEAFQPPQQ